MTDQEYHLNNDDLILAATWNPRGELARFERSLPLLKEIFSYIAISFPPARRRVLD